MRAIVYLILILSTTVVLSGCIKKSGYYDAGQKKENRTVDQQEVGKGLPLDVLRL